MPARQRAGLSRARTILVHDYLNQYGGAERVLEAMHDLAPTARVYTSLYDPDAMPDAYRTWDIRPAWVDRIPGAHRHHQRLLPLYPLAFERLRLPACDLVLSSSSAWAKMVGAPPGAVHVAYIHAPMRFAWDLERYVEREQLPRWVTLALRPLMSVLRAEDRRTSARIDHVVANSRVVRNRIRAYWRRDATVIHPPVDVEAFGPVPESEVQDYYLIVSRLVPYKRIDLAIEACNTLRLPLWIVGDGRDRARLERLAGPTVRFLGRVPDNALGSLYAHCRAALFMSEDDFGIVQVETQAAGRPVVALARGGALETVIPDVTGVYVAEQSAMSLIEALRHFSTMTWDPCRLVAHARSFSVQRFKAELGQLIDGALEARQQKAVAWS